MLPACLPPAACSGERWWRKGGERTPIRPPSNVTLPSILPALTPTHSRGRICNGHFYEPVVLVVVVFAIARYFNPPLFNCASSSLLGCCCSFPPILQWWDLFGPPHWHSARVTLFVCGRTQKCVVHFSAGRKLELGGQGAPCMRWRVRLWGGKILTPTVSQACCCCRRN